MTSTAYLMKSYISDPVIIFLVCSYSMGQVKPATSEKCITRRHTFFSAFRMSPSIPSTLLHNILNIHVSARSLQDVASSWVHNQNSGLLNRT